MTLGAVLVATGTALTGEVDWTQALIAIVVAVLGYIGVEGAADYARAKNGTP